MTPNDAAIWTYWNHSVKVTTETLGNTNQQCVEKCFCHSSIPIYSHESYIHELKQHPMVPLHRLPPVACTSCAARIETVAEAHQRCFQTVRHASTGGRCGRDSGGMWWEMGAKDEKDGKSWMLVFSQLNAGIVVCSHKKGSSRYLWNFDQMSKIWTSQHESHFSQILWSSHTLIITF